MPERNAIRKQIEADDGVPGSRARKNAQRAKDANPSKAPAKKDRKAKPVSNLFSKLSSKSKE